MDDIETKVIETITQLNDDENLGIDFPESYIEDLSKAYIKSELTDDELAELIRKLKQDYYWCCSNMANDTAGSSISISGHNNFITFTNTQYSQSHLQGSSCRISCDFYDFRFQFIYTVFESADYHDRSE